MPIIRTCSTEGCSTLTMGEDCIDHEQPVPATVFPRGRPFDRPSLVLPVTPDKLARSRVFRPHEAAEQAYADASVG